MNKLFLSFSFLACFPVRVNASTISCESKDAIVVNTKESRLFLCSEGRLQGNYPVAFGRGGFDKRVQGDDRTPLGHYSLGMPRGSDLYHQFIPINYPTSAQKAAGYTGSAIGIHGPRQEFSWLPSWAVTFINWTQGCLAVGSNREIEDISTWKLRHPEATISIF